MRSLWSTASYDWGDLSDINARITALEQKYGFSIYFGPEVPKRIDYYDIHQFKNKDKLSIALDSLEEILDCFPDDFFTQLCYCESICAVIFHQATQI